MPYSPPTGNGIVHNWTTSYTAPSSPFVYVLGSSGSDQYIIANGWESLVVGALAASWRQYIVPAAIQAGESFGEIERLYELFSRNHEWTIAYTPPAGDVVSHNFGDTGNELFPDGFDASSFGSATLTFGSKSIAPFSISEWVVPTPALRWTQYLTPSGLNAGAWGAAHVLGPQYIIPVALNAFKGFGFGADGTGFIDHAIRTLRPSGLVATAFGTAALAGGVRTVDVAGHGIVGAFGTLQIAYRERFIYPSWFGGGTLGTPVVDQTHFVTVTGWESLAFGTAYAHDNKQYLAPTAFTESSFGTAELSRSPRIIEPTGFVSARDVLPNERWGLGEIYNSDQYVFQLFVVTPYDGGVFGSPIWMAIENRNRTIHTYGHRDSTFGTAALDNKAVPLLPAGLDATSWGAALIAYRIRTVVPEGIEPLGFSNYNVVLKTPELFPQGFTGAALGTPGVVSTRRYYYNVAVGDTSSFGTAFVAPRVRSIEPYYSYEGVVGTPEVVHNPRYLLPTSITSGFGQPDVIEHFNIIYPRWVYRGAVGEPWIYNSTPNLFPYGYEQTEWGATAIRTAWRIVAPEGVETIVFPKPVIEYRTKTVRPAGLLAMRIGTGFDVRNVNPDPPVAHTIQPTGIAVVNQGTEHVVSGNVLYPEGLSAITWGEATVRLQGAIVPGINEWAFGTARVSGPQYVDLDEKGIKAPDEEYPSAKWAHVDPYTIWCWVDPPAQALTNNGGSAYEQIDQWLHSSDHPERPVFGTATVTHLQRTLAAAGDDFVKLGLPDVSLKTRRIYPQGLVAFKKGYPKLNATQYIDLAPLHAGIAPGSFGNPTIAYREGPDIPRYLLPHGIGGEWGAARVEHFNREVAPPGIAATTFGTGRIHPPEPLIPTGLDATLWGDAMIAYRIRTVYPEGWDGFVCDDEPGYFADRMRVYKTNLFRLLPTGIDGASWGGTVIDQSIRRISGAGAIGQWVIPHGASVRKFNAIVLAGYGWDSSLFGDVQKWEAGKIKPQGEQYDLWGRPRINRRMTVAGWESLGLGAPRMADAIDPDALDSEAWGLPTITHGDNLDFVCGQASRAIPPPGWDAVTFGTASVT